MADNKLVRELAVVLAIKLALLSGLWWAFVRDARVGVDAGTMAVRSLTAAPQTTNTTDGESNGH